MRDWILLLMGFSILVGYMIIVIMLQRKDLNTTKAVIEDVQNEFKELSIQMVYQQYWVILLEHIHTLSLTESDSLPEIITAKIKKSDIEYSPHLKDFWKEEEQQIKDYLRSQFPDLTNDMFEQFVHILDEYFKK